MIKILVAEDDERLNKLICVSLRDSGYVVESTFDGESALSKINNEKFDIIISDIMMPKMDGFTLAKNVRMFDKLIPILFISAREDFDSKQKGFSIGIDDYIVKPFEIDELILRIGALLRRANINASKRIEIGTFMMDEEERVARNDKNELNLTVREFDILFKMLSFPNKSFTRSSLMEAFWDYDSSATSRTVDVYMAKLREKTADIKEFEIVTVHGLGYKVVLK